MKIKKTFFKIIFFLALSITNGFSNDNSFVKFLTDSYYGYTINTIGDKTDNLYSILGKRQINDHGEWYLSIEQDVDGESIIDFTYGGGYLYELINIKDFVNIFTSFNYTVVTYEEEDTSKDTRKIGMGLGTEVYITSKVSLLLEYRVDYIGNNALGDDNMKSIRFYLSFNR